MHGGGIKENLADLLAKLARYRREAGTEKKPFEIHAISMDGFTLDGVKRLEDQGVTDVIVGFRDPYHMPDTPVAEKIEYLRRYAGDVIAATR